LQCFHFFPLPNNYVFAEREKTSQMVTGSIGGRVSPSPAQQYRRVVQSVSLTATISMPAPPLASSSRPQDAGSSSSSRAPPAASSNQVGFAASTARPAKSSQPPPAPSSGARSRAPSSASGGGGGGGGPTTRPRAQSNVGAKLLKKRQSVAYNQHPGLFATADGQAPYPPAVPAIPQGLATAGGPASSSSAAPPRPLAPASEGPSADHHHEPSSNKSSGSRQAPAPVVRTDAEKQLLAKGLDVDQLASDSFKPEDCKTCSSYNRCFSLLTRDGLCSPEAEPAEQSRRRRHSDAGPASLQGRSRERFEDYRGRITEKRFRVRLSQIEWPHRILTPALFRRPPAATIPNSSSSPRRLPPWRARCSS
jgi:hypothetical protein